MQAIWGTLVGDACGAVLEGAGSAVLTEDLVDRALTFPGGGPHRVGPGQITDDGELTIALYQALKNRDQVYPIQTVAAAYGTWYDSCPFDMGYTCSRAFELFSEGALNLQEIMALSASSEANGAMMRATPIAAWWAIHPLGSLEETACHAAMDAMIDASLSHPSLVTRHANAVYVYALTHLLLGTPPSATIRLVEAYEACPTVKVWIAESDREWADLPSAQIAVGHVRHAFIRMLWFLRHSEVEYREAIRWTLLSGGDTDTNAAIVGGAVACYHPIPLEMLDQVRTFDATQKGRWPQRPKEYVPRYALSQ